MPVEFSFAIPNTPSLFVHSLSFVLLASLKYPPEVYLIVEQPSVIAHID
jgi:hypothetical protein